MPNWCSNTVTITGNGAKEFLKACAGVVAVYRGDDAYHLSILEQPRNTFTFNALVPVPTEILNNDYSGKDKSIQSGYDWQIENWGTKWDPDDVHVYNEEEDEVGLSFDTAWGPATAWALTASKQFPELTFEYDYLEEGVGFAGREIYQAGKIISQKEISYSDDPEAYKRYLIDELEYDENYFEEDDDEPLEQTV